VRVAKRGLTQSLVFFIDRSLGKRIVPEALRLAGETVEIHDDHFVPDAKDADWLSEVGRRGWIVLTKDARIRYRMIEQQAMTRSSVAAFILTAGDVTGAEMANIFIKALPKMRRFVTKYERPFIASVTRSGAVVLIRKKP
jgi:predicted nuclease of predicted toxin-antitoxin system